MNSLHSIQFGDYLVDFQNKTLERCGVRVELNPQMFLLLKLFLENEKQLLSRETIGSRLWGQQIVNDNTLSKAVAELRKCLNDDSRQPKFIETVPKLGYRWIHSLELIDQSATSHPADQEALSNNVNELNLSVKLQAQASQARSNFNGLVSSFFQVGTFKTVSVTSLLILLLVSLVTWEELGFFLDKDSPSHSNTLAETNVHLLSQSDALANTKFTALRPFTSDAGVEFQPAFSNDNEWIAYISQNKMESAEEKMGGHFELMMKSVRTNQRIILDKTNRFFDAPQFSPDDSSIAYFEHDNSHCYLVRLRINPKKPKALSKESIYRCNPDFSLSNYGLQWSLDGNFIWFIEYVSDVQYQLKSIHLDTKVVEVIKDINPMAIKRFPSDDQFIIVEVEGQQMSVIRFNPAAEEFHSNISNTNASSSKNQTVKERLFKRTEVFYGIDVDPISKGVIATESLSGGKIVITLLSGEKSTLYESPNTLTHAAVSPNGKMLAFTESKFDYDLVQIKNPTYSLEEGKTKSRIKNKHFERKTSLLQNPLQDNAEQQYSSLNKVVDSSRFDLTGRYANTKNDFVFVSNRSGHQAVWLKRQDETFAEILFEIETDQWPYRLRWSPDDKKLLVNLTGGNNLVYDFQLGHLTELETVLFGVPPSWSINEQWLLLPQPRGNDGLFIEEKSVSSFVKQNGRSATKSLDNHVLNPQKQPIEKSQIRKDYSPLFVENISGLIAERSPSNENLCVIKSDNTLHFVDLKNNVSHLVSENVHWISWHSLSCFDDGMYYLKNNIGYLTIYHWSQRDKAEREIKVISSVYQSGAIPISFTVSPDQKKFIHSYLGGFESDIYLMDRQIN